jgi:hypothetical protein
LSYLEMPLDMISLLHLLLQIWMRLYRFFCFFFFFFFFFILTTARR